MRKLIMGLLAFSFGGVWALAGPVTVADASEKLYFQKGDEKLSITRDGRNIIRLEIGDRCKACDVALSQIERVAPRHPDLVFVIREGSASKPGITVGTTGFDALVGFGSWPEMNDQQADAYLDKRAAFAKDEYAIANNIMSLDKQIEEALSPGAGEIATLRARLQKIDASLATVKSLIISEPKAARLKVIVPQIREDNQAALKEYEDIQNEAAPKFHAVNVLRESLIAPLEEKIEAIRVKLAGALIRRRTAEAQRLDQLLRQDALDGGL